MAGLRKERIAHNEARFRSINETLEARLRERGHHDSELTGFVCECGDRGCVALLHVPLAAYRAVRANPRRFVVRPGPETPDVEDVVERRSRFFVVEKHAELAPVAGPPDPGRPA